MKRLLLLTLLIVFIDHSAGFAQSVGIAGTSIVPNSYSILEVRSNTKGVLLPRLNMGERATLTASGIGILEQGLTIYNTDTDHYNYWDGYAWVEIATSTTATGAFVENQNTYQQTADFNIAGDGITSRLGVGTAMGALAAQVHVHDDDPTGGNTTMLVEDFVGNPIMSVIDYGHVGFGTAAPSNNAVIDVTGSQGVLLPRMTNTYMTGIYQAALGAADAGMIVYDSSNGVYNWWDGSSWQTMGTPAAGLYIDNQNSVVQPADFVIGGKGVATGIGVGTGLGVLNATLHVQDDNPGAGNQLVAVEDFVGSPLVSVFDVGNIGIGTNAPNTNSTMDIQSNGKGILLPRMTDTQRNTYGGALGGPEKGMTVFDTVLDAYFYWDGTQWVEMISTSTLGNYIENQNTALQPADYRIAGLGVASQMGIGTGMGAILADHHIHDANTTAGNQLFLADDYVGNPIMSVFDVGNTAFGHNTPNPHALVDMMDTLRGVLMPRLTTSQKATLTTSLGPTEEGLMIYDLGQQTYDFWDGAAWSSAGSGPGAFIDNQNTGPQVADFWIGGNGETDQLGVGTNGGGFAGNFHVHDDNGAAGDMLVVVDDFVGNHIFNVVDAGHVTIGATVPAAHSILDVQSNTKGILLPRMNPAQMTTLGGALAGPDNGMTVYNSVDNRYEVWDGTQWVPQMTGTPGDFIENQNTVQQPSNFNVGGQGVVDQLGVGTGLNPVVGLAHIKDNSPTAGSRLLNVEDFVGNPVMSVVDLGQVGLGTTAPAGSAILDMNSNNKGFLPPRMTAAQRAAIGGPVQGLIVYQTTGPEVGLWHYDGGMWQPVDTNYPPSALEDQDADTKVEVEQSPDDDIIRFTNAGVEYFDFDAGRFNINNTGGSVFIGEGAGANDDLSSNRNIEIGYQSGNLNTTGDYNTDIGYQAGAARITGSQNTHIGYKSGTSNTGDNNTSVGSRSLELNTTGSSNTAIGESALTSNGGGDGNTAVGEKALASNTSGSSNVAVGRQAMDANQTGANNVSVGTRSSYSNTNGAENAVVGHNALYTNSSGSYITSIGTRSLYNNTASWNTAIGWQSMYDNTSGEYNVAVGESTLGSNTTGEKNVAVGYEALNSATTANNNTAVGARAMTTNTTGSENSAFGHNSLYHNTSGDNNTSVGHNSMYANTTGWDNTAVGHDALNGNTTGYSNTVIGKNAMELSTTGYANTVVGKDAMAAASTANLTTSIGMNSLQNLTSGNMNTGIGFGTLNLSTTGYENTAIGHGAGHLITTGYQNTCLGKTTNVGATVNNSTAIGFGAYPTASNSVEIGNSSVTSIGGYANWTNLSDGRCKQNIKGDVPGLEFVTKLRPVTYNLDLDAIAEIKGTPDEARTKQDEAAKEQIVYTGLIAQEVEQAAKDVNYDFSGVDAPQNENDHYALRYAEFVAPLIQSVKELNEMNRDLKRELEVLRKQVAQINNQTVRK